MPPKTAKWEWLTMRIQPELKRAIEAAAAKDDRDVSAWVRRALQNATTDIRFVEMLAAIASNYACQDDEVIDLTGLTWGHVREAVSG